MCYILFMKLCVSYNKVQLRGKIFWALLHPIFFLNKNEHYKHLTNKYVKVVIILCVLNTQEYIVSLYIHFLLNFHSNCKAWLYLEKCLLIRIFIRQLNIKL